MALLEIILNISTFEAISGIMIILTSIFGAPYLIRAQNKKDIGKKANQTELVEVRNKVECMGDEVEKKATYAYVDKEVDEVKGDQREDRLRSERQFNSIDKKLTELLLRVTK